MEYAQAIAGPAQDVESKDMSPPPSWRYFVNGEGQNNRAGAQGIDQSLANWALSDSSMRSAPRLSGFSPLVRFRQQGFRGNSLDNAVYAGLRIAIEEQLFDLFS